MNWDILKAECTFWDLNWSEQISLWTSLRYASTVLLWRQVIYVEDVFGLLSCKNCESSRILTAVPGEAVHSCIFNVHVPYSNGSGLSRCSG